MESHGRSEDANGRITDQEAAAPCLGTRPSQPCAESTFLLQEPIPQTHRGQRWKSLAGIGVLLAVAALTAAAACLGARHQQLRQGTFIRSQARQPAIADEVKPSGSIERGLKQSGSDDGERGLQIVIAGDPVVADSRVCLQLKPGMRLADGTGFLQAKVGKFNASECVKHCQSVTDCAQAVFSKGNDGCYLFRQATHKLAGEGNPLFVSAFCGKKGEQQSLEGLVAMANHQVQELRAEAMESVATERAHTAREALEQVHARWDHATAKAEAQVGSMQLQQKLQLLSGRSTGSGFAGYVDTSSAPGAQPLKMNDGPQGFNPYTREEFWGTTTQFPSLIGLAATWDPKMASVYAGAIADEFVTKGANVLLGPDIEVSRAPLSGRSFESLSGEDPYLGSQLAAAYVKAVQHRGIMVTVKHWLDNSQEVMRMTMNVNVSDRPQHEIYMPPFKAAFEAGAAAVMCSYNKVYGYHSCENSKLLKELLRNDLGFRGMVMSDWEATHTAEWSAKGGLDVEMPGGPAAKFNQLAGLVGQGTVPQETIDGMATHVLAAMHFVGHYEGKFKGSGTCITGVDATSDDHRAISERTIVEGAVLLKNDGAALPIVTAGKKIALIGQYCNKAEWISAYMGRASPFMGGGSGYVPTKRTVTPMQGLQWRVKDAASLTWSADASAGQGADVAVVCASMSDVHEGWDRPNFTLPEAQELISSLRSQGGKKQIVLVGVVPGEVTTEWIDQADAALFLFMPGEQIGPAMAQLLTGDASPGGRLPVSMPPDGEQPQGTRYTNEQYPGTESKEHPWGKHLTAQYSEGVLTGYRWYDANHKAPKFPFGHGLDYTEFEFKDHLLKCFKVGKGADDTTVAVLSLSVANTGNRTGTAVPQVYVGFPSLRPALRYLRGFTKVSVPAHSEASVTLTLTEEDWSFYDEESHRWVSALSNGEDITVSVGVSSGALLWHETLSCPN